MCSELALTLRSVSLKTEYGSVSYDVGFGRICSDPLLPCSFYCKHRVKLHCLPAPVLGIGELIRCSNRGICCLKSQSQSAGPIWPIFTPVRCVLTRDQMLNGHVFARTKCVSNQRRESSLGPKLIELYWSRCYALIKVLSWRSGGQKQHGFGLDVLAGDGIVARLATRAPCSRAMTSATDDHYSDPLPPPHFRGNGPRNRFENFENQFETTSWCCGSPGHLQSAWSQKRRTKH
jgi:hypothetical protein